MNRILITLLSLQLTFGAFSQELITQEYICPPCGNTCDEAIHQRPGVCMHCNMVLVKKDLSKTIAFYLQDGVEVLDFAGPMEVFSYAGYEVFTVSKDKQPIKSQGILSVLPDYSIEDAPKADILAFFGGNAQTAYEDKSVISWIKKQQDVQYHFSVCTGAFLLAESGLLNGKTATTFHNALEGLETYKKVDVRRDVRFVDNGKVITTAGISAGIDGALHLVAKLQGLNAAKRTAYYMEYDNWVPGDGLILSKDNPYQKEQINLSQFTGKYEYKEGVSMQLVLKDGELQAKLDGLYYPLYHEDEDLFSDVDNEPVYFRRDDKGLIIGYAREEAGKLFKRVER